MKTAALRNLRRKLANKESVYGLWITLESASITEIAVASGMDWVVIDAEHGHLDWHDIVNHIRAAVRSNTVVLVRIAELQEGLVKRVLDIGADGVVIPHVETPEELSRALSFSRYPPAGIRGIGAERATGWGQCFAEHAREANDAVLVVPIIESVRAGDNIRSLLEVPGTDIFFFGPADYSASAGYAGQWEVPSVSEHMNKAKDQIIKAGKYCGIVTTGPEDLAQRNLQGYRMLAYGSDAGMIIRSLRHMSAILGRDRRIRPDLAVDAVENTIKLNEVPPDFQPDRFEVVSKTGEGGVIELAPGISCEPMVSGNNGSLHLFTAIVTFAAGESQLPSHTHPHAESITLLTGNVCVEVAQRRYVLKPLDNVTIPGGMVHRITNLSQDQRAVFHIAMPAAQPLRELAEQTDLGIYEVADDFSGHLGPERVSRYQTSLRYQPEAGTECIDFFNDALMPGIGMSGGYGLFHPNGRLPAHLHDFDESVCIVSGEATFMVEGRLYMMSDLETAMVPRGRIHYFLNHSQKAMAMIWVYAGPMPVRIEVDDRYADGSDL